MPALHLSVHLLIFCTKRTSKSQRFKRGGSTIVLNVKRFHMSAAFEWGFDFNPLGLSTLTFYKTSFSIEKMGFMYCIVCFVPAKYVDYHPRYVTQRFLLKFNLQTALFKFYLQTAFFKFYLLASIPALLSPNCSISSH